VLLVCVLAATAVTAMPLKHKLSVHVPVGTYVAPGPTDCRSPCPALNTLANHGYLPRDGKNIDKETLKNAMVNVLGLSSIFGGLFAKVATKKFAVSNTFSLCDALKSDHNSLAPPSSGIEHLASLTREDRTDFTTAGDLSQRAPNSAQIDILLKSSKDGKMITIPDFVRARQALWNKSFTKNPALKNDATIRTAKIVAAAEGCLLMGVLSGNSNGGQYQISVPYAQSILVNERFPAGWKKNSFWWGFGIPNIIGCLTKQGFSALSQEVRATVAKFFGAQLG